MAELHLKIIIRVYMIRIMHINCGLLKVVSYIIVSLLIELETHQQLKKVFILS